MVHAADLLRKAAMRLAWHSGFASGARQRFGGLGSIIMLHRVRPDSVSPLGVTRSLAITPDFLDKILAFLKAEDTEFVSMDEMVERVTRGTGGRRRFVAVTLDDGYKDNLSHAYPVFKKHNVPFTVYVAPGFIDGSAVLWWEVAEKLIARSPVVKVPDGPEWRCSTLFQKRRAFHRLMRYFSYEVDELARLPALLDMCAAAGVDCGVPANQEVMNWSELRQMAADPLCTIGAHTVHHYNLKRLSADGVTLEMRQSADMIGNALGKRPAHFAFPYGSAKAAGKREADIAAKEGFASAVTTRHGTIHPEHRTNLHALPRISLNGRFQKLVYAQAMLSGVTTPLANAGRRVVLEG